MLLIRKNVLFMLSAVFALALTGCGGDDDNPYGLENDDVVKASKSWTWTCPEGEGDYAGKLCKTRSMVNKMESYTFGIRNTYTTVFRDTQAAATEDTAEAGVKYYLHVQHAYFENEGDATPISGSESEVSTVYALLKHTPAAEN